jgi:hypothetical protein
MVEMPRKLPKGKRRASSSPEVPQKKATTSPDIQERKAMEVPKSTEISPSSKIKIFKLDVISCNGRDLSGVEIGAATLEKIWTDSIIRELDDLIGYTAIKSKGGTEIRLQYQLKNPMSIREIAWESEFNHEQEGPRGTEILRCRVVGLSGIRQPTIGEKVRVTFVSNNFDVTPDQMIEWISRYGKVHEGHR